MRSMLEKSLIALLNEDESKADALFHDFILERSRQIHESLRQGEDFILDESMENELAIDEMFSDEDLEEGAFGEDGSPRQAGADARKNDEELHENPYELDSHENEEWEEGWREQNEELGDDLEESEDEFTDEDGEVSDDVSGDVGGDVDVDADFDSEEGDEEPATIEDRVGDLEADLQRLAAEFDSMMDDEETEVSDEQPVEEGVIEITAHANGEIDITATTDDEDEDDFGVEPNFDATPDFADADISDDDLTDEDFDDLSESAVDTLEKVSIATGDGREQGNGKFKQNGKSVLPTNGVNDRAFKGKPVVIKSSTVTGYPEPAKIASKSIAVRQNIKAKATDGQSGVKKEGDASALLNKPVAVAESRKAKTTPGVKK